MDRIYDWEKFSWPSEDFSVNAKIYLSSLEDTNMFNFYRCFCGRLRLFLLTPENSGEALNGENSLLIYSEDIFPPCRKISIHDLWEKMYSKKLGNMLKFCYFPSDLPYLKENYRVFAFELDGENFRLAKKLSEEKHFCVENLGLGAFRHTAKYTHDPCKVFITKEKESGTSSVCIVDLDYYVREKHIQRVDFIKLDVEGAEVDVIKGAATVIARFKPILAVSIYHKIEHLWTIPKLIKSIRSDYEFCLRHFVTSAEDAPILFTEELLKDLYSVTGSAGFISFGECVLFAR